MVYYFNETTENVYQVDDNLTEQQILELQAMSLTSEVQFLKILDIKDFNYFIFENDMDRLQDEEVEFLWENYLTLIMDSWDEEFLFTNLDEMKDKFNNTEEKKLYLKKIVFFVMYIFPYEILKNTILNIDKYNLYKDEIFDMEDISKTKLFEVFSDDNENIHTLKDVLLNEINKKIDKLENWYDKMDEITSESKKDLLKDSVDILYERIQEQKKFLKLYQSLIMNTPLDNLINLIRTYIKNDYYNIVG